MKRWNYRWILCQFTAGSDADDQALLPSTETSPVNENESCVCLGSWQAGHGLRACVALSIPHSSLFNYELTPHSCLLLFTLDYLCKLAESWYGNTWKIVPPQDDTGFTLSDFKRCETQVSMLQSHMPRFRWPRKKFLDLVCETAYVNLLERQAL